ncbi:MAG: hypothetical protein RL354_2161 [Planctomycetota bacterium]
MPVRPVPTLSKDRTVDRSRTRCHLAALRFGRAALAVWCALLAACASQRVVDRFGEIQTGMTREEVIAILGEPSSRWTLSVKVDAVDGERLQWGDGLSSLASGAVYHGKPDRAYCVDFDRTGKVVDKAAPVWLEQPDQ